MYATILALIAAAAAYTLDMRPAISETVSFGFGALIFLLAIYLHGMTLIPLQKGEQKISPRLIELFQQDKIRQALFAFLALTPLLFLIFNWIPEPYGLPITVLGVGIALDALRIYANRLADYFNPFYVVELLNSQANRAIDNDQDIELCNLIGSISEVAVLAVERHNGALANEAVDSLEKISKRFLAAAKSISHPTQNPELKAQGAKDTLSYVLLLILRHLDSIQENARIRKLHVVVEQVIKALSKIATYSAGTDLSLALLPLHYIDKNTHQALQKGDLDIGVKSSIGLLELAKSIGNIQGVEYLDIKPSMIKLISILESIAKDSFKKDKTINLQILIAPFNDLNSILEKPAFKDHPDAPFLIQQVKRIIEEFQALEAVLKTMPTLPKIVPEEETAPQKP